MKIEDIKLRSMNTLQALAADSVLTQENPYDPDEFAEHCCRMVAAMALDDSGTSQRWTVQEIRNLPDGILQDLVHRCTIKRAKDQSLAKKNFEAEQDERPVVSLECSDDGIPIDSSQKSVKPTTSNGQESLRPTTKQENSSTNQVAKAV